MLDTQESEWKPIQDRIAYEGYGARFLSCRDQSGHWGIHFYQPKWISMHYTLTDLKNLGISQDNPACNEMVIRTFKECQKADGSHNLSKYDHPSDVAVSAMVLNYGAHFLKDDPRITRLVDWLLSVQKEDGRYEWEFDSPGSAPHTTICVLEGLRECLNQGVAHRIDDILEAESRAIEYLLRNNLFIDHPDKRYMKLSYPYRYRYDLLRVLEYLAGKGVTANKPIEKALEWLKKKRQDGNWLLDHVHPGNLHFEMETLREPSRIITSKALLILSQFD